ncbi:MAG: hypothetical protein ETSY2_39710, partial [Candidatus Entotheonella gemina]
MLDVTLTVTLVLQGPVLSQATAMGNLGFDAHMARNHQGHYYMPFSLVRGRLRQAWEEINDLTNGRHAPSVPALDILLGPQNELPESRETSDFRPRRGRLHMTDFTYTGDGAAPEALYRVRVDAERGSVDDGAMQIIESPFAPGQHVPFTGHISYRAQHRTEAEAIEAYIRKGLRWMPCPGAERTSGFGRLLEVKLEAVHEAVATAPSAPWPQAANMFHLAIQPQAPICVSSHQVAPNLGRVPIFPVR